jgi:hypothetical protein
LSRRSREAEKVKPINACIPKKAPTAKHPKVENIVFRVGLFPHATRGVSTTASIDGPMKRCNPDMVILLETARISSVIGNYTYLPIIITFRNVKITKPYQNPTL